MRYFFNNNATLPVNVGGYSIQFETFRSHGGSWVGVVAADGRRADLLAKIGKRIREINLKEYEAEKKRLTKLKTVISPSSPPASELTQDLPPGKAPAAANAGADKKDISEVVTLGRAVIQDDLAESMVGREPTDKKKKKYLAPSDKT